MSEGTNGQERCFQEISSLLELINSQKHLLQAQVILSDPGQKHTDERLNTLIAVVDELARDNRRRGPSPPTQ